MGSRFWSVKKLEKNSLNVYWQIHQFECISNVSRIFIDYFTMLHMEQLNSKNTLFLQFDKILVIQPIAEVYGESNERQLCLEICWYPGFSPCHTLLPSLSRTICYTLQMISVLTCAKFCCWQRVMKIKRQNMI